MKNLVIIAVCLLTGSACGETAQKEAVVSVSQNQQWIKNLEGNPGIIGDIDFIEIPSQLHPEVNFIQVLNRKEKLVVSQATGTRLRDESNHKDYILTAAHFFSYELNESPENFILYIGKNGEFEHGDWFGISPKLYTMIEPEKRDVILIPVNYDKTAAAYNVSDLLKHNNINFPSEVTILSTLNLKIDKKLRKVKQTADLKGEMKLSSLNLKTDADLFTGMSGSPVFNEKEEIIGVVSRTSRARNCQEYGGLNCYNLIAPIEQSWIEGGQQNIYELTPNLFKRIAD